MGPSPCASCRARGGLVASGWKRGDGCAERQLRCAALCSGRHCGRASWHEPPLGALQQHLSCPFGHSYKQHSSEGLALAPLGSPVKPRVPVQDHGTPQHSQARVLSRLQWHPAGAVLRNLEPARRGGAAGLDLGWGGAGQELASSRVTCLQNSPTTLATEVTLGPTLWYRGGVEVSLTPCPGP